MDETPENRANADMSLAVFDAMADRWAEEVNLTAIVKNLAHVFRLTRHAPSEVKEKFARRLELQIDAVCRQCFLEGAIRATDGKEPHDPH